jgi:hypothetical protein
LLFESINTLKKKGSKNKKDLNQFIFIHRGEAEGRSSADILVDALQDLTPKQEEELFQKKGQVHV